jgi:hypothetical protein
MGSVVLAALLEFTVWQIKIVVDYTKVSSLPQSEPSFNLLFRDRSTEPTSSIRGQELSANQLR